MPGLSSRFFQLKTNVVNIIFMKISSKLDQVYYESMYSLELREYFINEGSYYAILDALYDIFINSKATLLEVIKNMFEGDWPSEQHFRDKLLDYWKLIDRRIFNTLTNTFREINLYYYLYSTHYYSFFRFLQRFILDQKYRFQLFSSDFNISQYVEFWKTNPR